MDHINDFAFKIATANGTGSASANGLIMQAIFRMGVPVTGKNVFPSNIQGLPTWYEIRVNKHGYTARTPHFDLIVAHEPCDLRRRRRGSAVRRLAALRLHVAARSSGCRRPDVTYLGIPLAEMCNAHVQGRARAHPDEEHRLCRRAGRAARHRHRNHPGAAQGEVREEAGADGLEPEGGRSRLRLRERALRLPAADPPRADGRDEGLDPDRRQHRRGAGLPLCRRDRRRVVSDHAGDVADGSVQGLLPEIPARARDDAESLRHSSGRRRTGRHRHGHRRRRGPARARSRRRPVRASR